MPSYFGRNVMKDEYFKVARRQIIDWYTCFNSFAKSMADYRVIIKQFNSLNRDMRDNIKDRFGELDKLSTGRGRIRSRAEWELCLFVNLHIISGEYEIDPLTVIMCCVPICGRDQKILLQ